MKQLEGYIDMIAFNVYRQPYQMSVRTLHGLGLNT